MIYARRPSALHAARAWVAGAWCVALATAAIAFQHPLVLGALLIVTLAAGVLARVGRAVARTALLGLPFALAIALINPLVVRDGLTVIARGGTLPVLGRLDITLEATAYGGVLGLRALVLLCAFVLLARCVDPDELLRSFRRLSYRSAVTTALATRLVPVLARDARRLHEAQRARAGAPAPRLAVLRAVTAGALDRSVDVAATLEVRGYGGARRPRRAQRPWSRHDRSVLAGALALGALVVWGLASGVAAFEPYPRFDAAGGPGVVLLSVLLAAAALAPLLDRRGVAR